MTTGAKVWFWLVLIINGIGAVSMLGLSTSDNLLTMLFPQGYLVISALVSISMAIGAAMLLKCKKAGFYVIVGAEIFSVVVGTAMGGNIVSAIIIALIQVGLIFYFVNKNSDVIQ